MTMFWVFFPLDNQKCRVALTDDAANDTMQNLTVKLNVSDSGNGEKGLTVHLVCVTVATPFDRSLSKTSV